MGVEIERKFLIVGDQWRSQVERSERLVQGYLGGDRCSVRVRIAGDQAWLNIKSLTLGARRDEYEYAIPHEDAEAMLTTLCAGPVVSKRRHWIPQDGLVWEIDEFDGANAGLLVGEIELDDENQKIPSPDWLGREVTDRSRYYNSQLSGYPFERWNEAERRGEAC